MRRVSPAIMHLHPRLQLFLSRLFTDQPSIIQQLFIKNPANSYDCGLLIILRGEYSRVAINW